MDFLKTFFPRQIFLLSPISEKIFTLNQSLKEFHSFTLSFNPRHGGGSYLNLRFIYLDLRIWWDNLESRSWCPKKLRRAIFCTFFGELRHHKLFSRFSDLQWKYTANLLQTHPCFGPVLALYGIAVEWCSIKFWFKNACLLKKPNGSNCPITRQIFSEIIFTYLGKNTKNLETGTFFLIPLLL
jgi:hypothetical protein